MASTDPIIDGSTAPPRCLCRPRRFPFGLPVGLPPSLIGEDASKTGEAAWAFAGTSITCVIVECILSPATYFDRCFGEPDAGEF